MEPADRMRCREGHESTEADYCSVCGVVIAAPRMSTTPPGEAKSPSSTLSCPACGEPRQGPTARFCEVCRHDFETGEPGPPPSPSEVAGPGPNAAGQASPSGAVWEAIVAIDPSLDTEPHPSAPCPTAEPARVYALGAGELLIGRNDDQREIHPDIPLHDPGASRRHAKLLPTAEGAVTLQDLASANGSCVNGEQLPPGTRRVLGERDQITLGRWTRISLRRRG